MLACIGHARDLLDSAEAVYAPGKFNIAYHLATLALEEIGRRSLIAVQALSSGATVPPAWPLKHSQDHIQKLFWAFFGANFFGEKITPQSLDEMRQLARTIHAKRKVGLYVDSTEDGFSIPREAITKEDADNIIKLGRARLVLAEGEKLRTKISESDQELQQWFLGAIHDPNRQHFIFSPSSMDRLTELKDALAWAAWLKQQFDASEEEARVATEEELQRSRNPPPEGTKNKWKMRIRILSDSHSIRPKVLNTWNEKANWIKLEAVSGKKNQLLIDFLFLDNVPIQGLWWFGWGVARRFVVALNIGTMGYWWWRLPQDISRFYESIDDLQSKMTVRLERQPSLKIDWGANRVLTEEELQRVGMCFAALPYERESPKQAAYNYYIGGLTFLSLNDVHWQCEVQAYGNFHESLKHMMKDAGTWKPELSFDVAYATFVDEIFPSLNEEREPYLDICRRFETKELEGRPVTLKEVSFIKIVCDAFFLGRIAPRELQALKETDA